MTQSEDSSQEETLSSFKLNINLGYLVQEHIGKGLISKGKAFQISLYLGSLFPVPDPIIEYKCSIEDDPLMKVNVPINERRAQFMKAIDLSRSY